MNSGKKLGFVFFQNLFCVIFAGLITYLFSPFVGSFYCRVVGGCSAGLASLDFTTAMGLLVGYFLFIPLVLTLFGTNGRNWWMIGLILTILGLSIYIGVRLSQLVPLIAIATVGFLVGTIANKGLWKIAPGIMAKIK